MNRSKVLLMVVIIGLFVVLLIVKDVRWKYQEKRASHITMITEAKYGEEWEHILAGARAAASEYGVILEHLAPDYERAYKDQITLLETAKLRKAEGIILAPIDPHKLGNTVVETMDTGIPVVSIVTPMTHLSQVKYIGVNQYQLGQELGALIIEENGEEGKLAIIALAEKDINTLAIETGLRDYLETHGHIQVIATYRNVKDTYAVSKTVEKILGETEATIFAGVDLVTTKGTADAVKATEVPTQVYGIDISEEMVDYMDQGVVQGLVVQNYFSMGYIVVEEMVALIEKRKSLQTVELEPFVVTAKNLYSRESQMILFPIK